MWRRLFRQFIVRQLLQERARTLTTIVGIALGVGVIVAIQLTNAASIRGFSTALDTVAGKAAIEIVGTGGIDERLLPELGWLREFGTASPVIEGEMAIVAGEVAQAGPPRRGAESPRRRHPARSHPARVRGRIGGDRPGPANRRRRTS